MKMLQYTQRISERNPGKNELGRNALLTQRSTDRGYAPRVSGAKNHGWLQANGAQS